MRCLFNWFICRRALAIVLCTLLLAPFAARAADASIDAVTVRLRTAATVASADDTLSARVATLFQQHVSDVRVERDGAVTMRLNPPLPFARARLALARLRLDDDVLYAQVGTFAPALALRSIELPTTGALLLRGLIVKYRAASMPLRAPTTAQLMQMTNVAAQPVAIVRPMPALGAHLVRLFTPMPMSSVEAIAAALALEPDVEWVEPDYVRHILATPNDPLYTSQWDLYEPAGGINMPAAWDKTRGWSGIRIGIIDTGILASHEDLVGRTLPGVDMVADFLVANDNDPVQPGGCTLPGVAPCISSRDTDAHDPGDWVTAAQASSGWLAGCDPRASSFHGTHVAGTIAAASNNAVGIAGINWVSRIVPARALGRCGGYDSDVIDAMTWASGGTVAGMGTNPSPARVLNLSLGGTSHCGLAYQTAINDILSRNTVIAIAAGNENQDAVNSAPGNCNGVITVAATGRAGQRASYSNYDSNDGSGVQVEIAAPGGDGSDGIKSTLNTSATSPELGVDDYEDYQGTSMATPHVAAVASLLLSVKPALTPAQVLSALTTSARPFPPGTGRDCTANLASVTSTVKYCGAGILDANAALINVLAGMTITTAVVAASPNPSAAGANVTFTAQVTGTAPTGSVAFRFDDIAIPACASVALAGSGNTRTAQCFTAALAEGSHVIVATYSGNATNTPADSATVTQVVGASAGASPTITTLLSTPSPSMTAQAVVLTAQVAGDSPTGSVAFKVNAATIAGCAAVALNGSGDIATATCTTTTLPLGTDSLSATYGGDAGNQPSAATLSHVVAAPGPCSGFVDVASTSPFCANVEWLRNRAITVGCTDTSHFCPDAVVTRLAMAAFMNRLGAGISTDARPVVEQSFATFTPTTSYSLTCKGGAIPAAAYPRVARVQGTVRMSSNTGIGVAAATAYSDNAEAQYLVMQGSERYQTITAGGAPTLSPYAVMPVPAGETYYFALGVGAIVAGGSVTVDCSIAVQLSSYVSGVSPFGSTAVAVDGVPPPQVAR